jgi:lipopolysaccharide exporter
MRADAPDDLADRVARGALATFGATVATRVLGVIQSIVVARLLDPYRLGLLAIVSYVLGVAGALSDLGMPVAVMKLTAEDQASRPRAVLRVIGRSLTVVGTVSLGVGAALLLGAAPLAALYQEPSLAALFRLAAVALVLAVLGGFRAGVLQGFHQIHRLAALGVLNSAAMLGLTLTLVPWLGLPGVILASIGTECLAWLWATGPLARSLRAVAARSAAVPASAADGAPWLPRVFHLAAPAFLNGFALVGAAWSIRSWLAHVEGYEAVGFYQIADSVARTLTMVAGAVAVPLAPAVAELDATRPRRIADGLETVLRGTLFLTWPAAAFLALGGSPLIVLVFGASYAAAGPVVAWLALAALLQAAANVLWSAQVGAGRVWTGFAITAAGQGALVGVALVAVPHWGLPGLGAAVLLGQALTLVLAARDVRLHVGMSLAGVRGLGLAIASTGAAVVGLHWLEADGLTSAFLVAGGAVLGALGLARPSERRLVREMTSWATASGDRRA